MNTHARASRKARTFWVPTLLRFALLCLIILAVAASFGVVAGLVWFGLSLVALLFLQIWSLYRIEQWLDLPYGTPRPKTWGLWAHAAKRLENVRREDERSRVDMAEWLARFRQAMSLLPDGVVIVDGVMHLEWCNPTAEKHLGLDQLRDEGRLLTNLIRAPEFVDYMLSSRFEQPLAFVHHHRKIQLQLISFDNRRQIIVTHDLTQAEKNDTLRRDFIANASHELRTPLTVINGFLEHALSTEMDHKTRQRQLNLMAEQGQRMQRLVADMLALTRLESLVQQPSAETVRILPMLHRIVDQARALSEGRHLITLDAQAIDLKGNHDELESAFTNLLTNAVRYTPDGGSIQISWKMVGEGAALGVCDDGIGIAAEHLSRLTERFYRVDKTRSRITQGTGLGLAIVKHVLLRHRGHLLIESAPGKGSCFSAVFDRPQLILSDVKM
ncbi:phosphate regulon sensor histidine kinase PhoR [Glaciimonas immobilis]|uniref:Phosphate regulon sensor protein PhoR n=1 Tax=Glaciimonas immobilis TaxID=728004 RepID=A0A840RPH9_9BURK|nr:phosphate regulon sensor histidine kinase PhoR [Glaciimonas immobilis]KAF3999376.1 phosphate regulon sensor histidine kinase PhoR [Glaciimonas immobilis]MBB5198868.1 two-component system phosphate regulon sensor histidine kinase PhoR [Glaciimonas immobilis]